MAQSLARTGSVHHSVSDVSPRPAMRSDGAQLFPTYSSQTEPLSEAERGRAREGEREGGNERERKGQRDAEKVQTSRDKREIPANQERTGNVTGP